MVEFKNEQDFEDWLKDKPKDWAVLLSSRAALRVLPALAGLAQNRATASANIFLPFFHGMALPWAAAKYPALGNERRFYTNRPKH